MSTPEKPWSMPGKPWSMPDTPGKPWSMPDTPGKPWSIRVTPDRPGTKTKRKDAAQPVQKRARVPWGAFKGSHIHPEDLAFVSPSPPKWEEQPAPLEPAQARARVIGAHDYAAVDPEGKLFGLIDLGCPAPLCRSLIVHVRKNRVAWPILNPIRPGTMLQVRLPTASQTVGLRVRFTTPAGYYSPGAKVSTLAIGVDESDWRSLAATAPRI